jgi:hypothetical protein
MCALCPCVACQGGRNLAPSLLPGPGVPQPANPQTAALCNCETRRPCSLWSVRGHMTHPRASPPTCAYNYGVGGCRLRRQRPGRRRASSGRVLPSCFCFVSSATSIHTEASHWPRPHNGEPAEGRGEEEEAGARLAPLGTQKAINVAEKRPEPTADRNAVTAGTNAKVKKGQEARRKAEASAKSIKEATPVV